MAETSPGLILVMPSGMAIYMEQHVYEYGNNSTPSVYFLRPKSLVLYTMNCICQELEPKLSSLCTNN